MASRAPVSRSRLNGRLRSASPAAMPAASVQPAIGRLTRMIVFASCWYPSSLDLSCATQSLRLNGVLRPEYALALSSAVRTRSIAGSDPFVATSMASAPRLSSRAAGTCAAGQVIPALLTPCRGPLYPSAGNSAVVAPAGHRPRAGKVASCAHETTPAGGPPMPSNPVGMFSPGTARTTTTPWTPGIERNRAASGAAGAAGPRAGPGAPLPGDAKPDDTDSWSVTTGTAAALPNRVPSLAFCVVRATTATV